MTDSGGPKVAHLSPSKISTYTEKCGLMLKYELDYRQAGIPIPSSFLMVGGRTVHKVIEFAMKEVRDGRKLPSAQDLTDRFDPAWDAIIREEELKKTVIVANADDPPEQIKRECKVLVPVVHADILTKLKPELVEETFKEEVYDSETGERFIVWGQIDLQEYGAERMITDWKTTRNVSANAKKYSIQMMAYAWWQGKHYLLNGQPTNIRKIFLVRGDNPHIEMASYVAMSHDREFFEQAAKQVWRATRANVYVPNINGWWCSEKFCSFYGPCRGGA